MGFSESGSPGYAVEGGEGRSHLPGAVSAPPAVRQPAGALAVVQIPSPARPYAGLRPRPQPPTIKAAPVKLFAGLLRAATSQWSAPPHPAPMPLVSALAVRSAPLTGATPDLNPTTTAGPVEGAEALPIPRLLLAGSLIFVGLSQGGAWRWLAVAGAVLGGSAIWTFVNQGGASLSSGPPVQLKAAGPAIESRTGRSHF